LEVEGVSQRRKLSTTIGASNYDYLRQMVTAGRAGSIGEAVDIAVAMVRRLDNRVTLARQTAAYFQAADSRSGRRRG